MDKLTPKEAAERARVSLSLIYTFVSEGRLAHYRLGGGGKRGRILIDSTDLDALARVPEGASPAPGVFVSRSATAFRWSRRPDRRA